MSILNKKDTCKKGVLDLQYYRNTGLYDKRQLHIIMKAFGAGLTQEQIQEVANPNYKSTQMYSLFIEYLKDNSKCHYLQIY